MQTSIGVFSSTFAEIEDVDATVDEILTVAGLFYALSVAPVWNKCRSFLSHTFRHRKDFHFWVLTTPLQFGKSSLLSNPAPQVIGWERRKIRVTPS